jgi:hypothetical protein
MQQPAASKKNSDPPLQPLELQLMLESGIGELLDGYKCDSCSQAGTTSRRDLIFLLPQVSYAIMIDDAIMIASIMVIDSALLYTWV